MPIREQQTTNKQHAIPQSIMSVEFKIIGDLTLKQFFYLLAFCGLAYLSFMAVQIFIIKWFLVITLVGTGLCFAFLPLGDRGLDVWVVNFIRAMFMPNQFVYRKQEQVPNVFLYQNLDVLRSELITLSPTTSRRKIEAYLEQQTVPIDKLDYDETSYILKVKEAYSQGYGSYSTPTVTTTTIEEEVPTEAPRPEASIFPPNVSPPDLTELELPAPKQENLLPSPTSKVEPIVEKPGVEQIIKSQTVRRPVYQKPEPQDNYVSPTMTPDMHAGRRFINLASEAGGGEIILPIRGERVLKSVDEQKYEIDEAEKVQQLDSLIKEIKSKELTQKKIIESQKAKQGEEERKQRLVSETQKVEQQELAKVAMEKRAAQQEAERQKQEADRRRQEEQRLAKLHEQEELLKKQKEELLKKQEQEARERQRTQPQPIPLTPLQTEESPTVPNIIWGVVTTMYQNSKVPVPGVVVVIRNQRREVVRAVKTSAQGKFEITTPLINGPYTLEVDKEKKSGLTFEATAIEAKGTIIPTTEILGKA